MNIIFTEYLQQQLSILLKENIVIHHQQQVFGGDINQSFILFTNQQNFFVKINSASRKDMFEKEFNGLLLLRSSNALTVPQPLLFGEYENTIYLVMELIEKGNASKNFWKEFGYGLAALHKKTQEHFGLNEDNYIGSLSQQNNDCNTWAEFFASQRIMPLMHQALQQDRCSMNEIKMAEQLCKKLNEIFPGEPPALLHGDLWNGNYMVGSTGSAVIYDPAVYYGHREMDIGMTLLFGGFDVAFYSYYNEAYPLETHWKERVELCQLYPLLVHLLLFGGHYYYSVKEIIEKYQ